MVHYKLYYFNMRGLGEVIRVILTYAGQTFEDVRFSFKEWPAYKSKMLYGKVPVLEVDGKPLAECLAICGYLAREYGLSGKDSWEQAKIDEFASMQKDINREMGIYFAVFTGRKPGDKEQMYKELFLPTIQKYMPIYEKILQESNSGYIAKSGLTWVDFLAAEYLQTLINIHPEVMQNYPTLEQFVQLVHSHPKIKNYVQKRLEHVNIDKYF